MCGTRLRETNGGGKHVERKDVIQTRKEKAENVEIKEERVANKDKYILYPLNESLATRRGTV